jgi:hypothetical protein
VAAVALGDFDFRFGFGAHIQLLTSSRGSDSDRGTCYASPM